MFPAKVYCVTDFGLACRTLLAASALLSTATIAPAAAPFALLPGASAYSANAYVRYFNHNTEENYTLQASQADSFDALPFHGGDTFSFSSPGGSAAVESELDVTLNSSADKLNLVSSWSGSVTHSNTGQHQADANANAGVTIGFTLTESASYSWSNSAFLIGGDAAGYAVLKRLSNSSELFHREKTKSIDVTQGSFTGFLTAGSYQFIEFGRSDPEGATLSTALTGSFDVQSQFQVTVGNRWANFSGGNFSSDVNWSFGTKPGLNDTAIFDNGGGSTGTYAVQLAADEIGRLDIRKADVRLTGGSLTVNGAGVATVIGDEPGNNPATLQLSASLTTAADVRVGGASAGDLILNDDSNLTVGGTLNVGPASEAARGGAVLLKAGSAAVAAQVVIGKFGILTAERNIFVGPSPSGQRQLAVTGSLEVKDGGLLATKQTSRIDGTAAMPGSVTLSGAGTRWSVLDREIDDAGDVEPDQERSGGTAIGKLIVGSSGTAIMNVTTGANVFVDLKVVIGSTPASDGSMHFSTGGTGDLGFECRVGDQGTGAITVASGATAIVSNAAYVGYVNQSHGSITVSDPSSVFSVDSLGAGGAPFLHIGEAGIGTLTVNAGGRVAADAAEVVFGRFGTGKGTGLVTGAGARLDAATLDVAPLGIALLEVKNHGVVSTGDMRIGNGTAAQGRVVVTGGGQLLINNQGLEIGEIHGNSALARLTISDTGSLVRVNGVTRLHNLGLLDINTGAVLDTGGLIVDFGARVDGNGGRLVVGATIDNRGYVNRGLLAPGSSPGVLTIDGDYLQAPEGSLEIQIGGDQPGTEYDVLTVNGNMRLDGHLILQFLDGFAPQQGDQFDFLDVSGSKTGSFTQMTIENLAPGFQYNLSNNGSQFTLTALNDGVFVPEPTTLALLILGGLLVTFRSSVRRSLEFPRGT